eukprot:TRINITY_DN5064_c0_g1_i1.p1 TRINITY_DN5064_c0_g1~~TRINITY_DN5064_c0_g1_i1.p1  ORF type:complete len:212 (+),score=26.33 TRINITY_DN5064_c0_g1_i1:35-637(+)
MAPQRRIDRIDDRLRSIHHRILQFSPSWYEPAKPYRAAHLPATDVNPAFAQFAEHLEAASQETYTYYRNNRRALTAAETRFLARTPSHHRRSARYRGATAPSKPMQLSSSARYGLSSGLGSHATQMTPSSTSNPTAHDFNMVAKGQDATTPVVPDSTDMELSPGTYDITVTYVDSDNRPIASQQQRIVLEPGQELNLQHV